MPRGVTKVISGVLNTCRPSHPCALIADDLRWGSRVFWSFLHSHATILTLCTMHIVSCEVLFQNEMGLDFEPLVVDFLFSCYFILFINEES